MEIVKDLFPDPLMIYYILLLILAVANSEELRDLHVRTCGFWRWNISLSVR